MLKTKLEFSVMVIDFNLDVSIDEIVGISKKQLYAQTVLLNILIVPSSLCRASSFQCPSTSPVAIVQRSKSDRCKTSSHLCRPLCKKNF